MPKWWPGGGGENPEGKYYDPDAKPRARGGHQGRPPTTEHIVEGLLRNADPVKGARVRDIAKRVGEIRDGAGALPGSGEQRRLQHQVRRILGKFKAEGKVEHATGEPTGERGSPPSLWKWITEPQGGPKRPEFDTRSDPERVIEDRATGRRRHGANKGVPYSRSDSVDGRLEARRQNARERYEARVIRDRERIEQRQIDARERRENAAVQKRRGKPSDPLGDLFKREPDTKGKGKPAKAHDPLGDLLGTNKPKGGAKGGDDDEGGGLGIFRKA